MMDFITILIYGFIVILVLILVTYFTGKLLKLLNYGNKQKDNQELTNIDSTNEIEEIELGEEVDEEPFESNKKERKMKILKEQSDIIYNRYKELKQSGKYTKGYIQKMLSEEFEIGLTTAHDHGRGRELHDKNDENRSEEREVVEKKSVKEPIFELPKKTTMPYIGYDVATKSKNIIITGWEVRVAPDSKFIDCINQIAKHYNAEKFITPVWEKDLEYLPKILSDNFKVLSRNTRFNENLIFNYVETHAMSINPLSGWRGMFQESCIIPALTQDMQTEPSFHSCKKLMTTGSVGTLSADFEELNVDYLSYDAKKELFKRWKSLSNRSIAKAISKAQRIVRPCALLIQIIDDKIFLSRYIQMQEDGVVYDMDMKFTAGKSVPEKSYPEVMMTGDWHVAEMCPIASKETINMIEYFKPENVLLNDFFSSISANYHEIGSAAKFSKLPSILDEAKQTRDLLDEICAKSNKVKWLHSNHENFIPKVLDLSEDKWRLNNNYSTLCRLQAYRLDTDNPPIIELLKLDEIDNLEFIHEKDFFINRNVTFIHGHNSFRPMSFKGLSTIYGKLCTAHFHIPEIHRGMGYCVGTLSKPDLSYSIGINGSMPSNGIQHGDGSIQLLDIIVTDDGRGVWKI